MVQLNEISLPGKPKPSVQKNCVDLTTRAGEILQLLELGLVYKETGAKLNISANTAKKHVMNIYTRLHVNFWAQALRLAYEKGML